MNRCSLYLYFYPSKCSAKNAWGTNTGYGDSLREQGVDTARAQQLENWHNQQEVLAQRKNQRWMTEDFDNQVDNADEDWRKLASFGVERNQVRLWCCFADVVCDCGRFVLIKRHGHAPRDNIVVGIHVPSSNASVLLCPFHNLIYRTLI